MKNQLDNIIIRKIADPTQCSHEYYQGFMLGITYQGKIGKALRKKLHLLETTRRQMKERKEK